MLMTILLIKKDQTELTIKAFNSYDPCLNFTYELEKDNRIDFLDLTLRKKDNRIITDLYQKPTSSGRQINFLHLI